MAQNIIDNIGRERYTPKDFQAIRSQCVASNISRANRIVGRIFEEAFRDVGISSPQFALLVSLAIAPGSSAGDIAETLGSDPSTVSRNTELLLKRGLITVEPGQDRRYRKYFLSEEGDETVQSCVPLWKKAQRMVLKQVGPSDWEDIRKGLLQLQS
ncbi:MAG: MarR family winged helix-turn-helix transcriptional regulator [Alkalispirochaeta sp.]